MLFVLSCTPDKPQRQIEEDHAAYNINSLLYMKDPRTNICFATYRLGYNWGSFSMVPCENVPQDMLFIPKVQ